MDTSRLRSMMWAAGATTTRARDQRRTMLRKEKAAETRLTNLLLGTKTSAVAESCDCLKQV
jgi:hypothetical protein